MPEPLEMLQLYEHMKWSVQMYIALLHTNDDNGICALNTYTRLVMTSIKLIS